MMNQEKGLYQSMSNQFCKFDDMIDNGADLFRWSKKGSTFSLHIHNKPSQWI